MPGYVMHMAVASRIIEEKGVTNSSFHNAFLLGNIAPDAMERDKKKESHFWDDVTYAHLNRIPNLDVFLNKYKDRLDDPFVLGYYSHLLLDNMFVKEYWSEHFKLMDENMREENGFDKVRYIMLDKDNNVYDREEFFSDKLYYGDYDRIYPYIFQDWPFMRLDEDIIWESKINELDKKEVATALRNMILRVNKVYDNRYNHNKLPLKVFEIEHLYDLMDRVVRIICDI